jgi:type I restriction enzyme S subunit
MTALVTENMALLAGSDGGVAKLRNLILDLAIRGQLVPQQAADEPADKLLVRIAQLKAGMTLRSKVRAAEPAASLHQLPRAWVWTTLADAALINPRNQSDDQSDASFVPMAAIGSGFNDEHTQEARRWGAIKTGFTHFADGDIGVAKITPCFENSKACVFNGLVNGIGAGTTELHIVRPVGGTLAPRYVLAYLKAPWFLATGEKKMTGTAGQKRLPRDFVERHPFPLPPLAEQHRIVAKIDELMALCDRLEALQQDAEAARTRLVQALLDSLPQARDDAEFHGCWQRLAGQFPTLFTSEDSVSALAAVVLELAVSGRLVEQSSAEQPADQVLREVASVKAHLVDADGLRTTARDDVPAEEHYFSLPLGWSYARIGNLARFIDYRGRTPDKTPGGVPLITAKNVRPGCISREPREYIAAEEFDAWMTRGFPRVGDMLFTTEAPLGNVALIDIEERFALAQRVICFQLHRLEMGPYLRLAFMARPVQARILDMATGMTATGVRASRLKELPLPIPPLAEQSRIVDRVTELLALCDQLKARIAAARAKHAQLAEALVAQAVAA